MKIGHRSPLLALFVLAMGPVLAAQQLKPETERDFDCYIQAAEQRMGARPTFLVADADAALNQQLVGSHRIQTVEGNGANPHKVVGGLIFDWVGSEFISGATLDRTVRMLQDYDHRAQYFSETIATSKLICRRGEDQFDYSMRLKEPAVLDVASDVLWQRVDAHRWRCRSYSTDVRAVGKDKGYLRRLDSYWRFAEVPNGVYVEGETITLSDSFGALMRGLGSMMGINPEKSLKHSLDSMRETLQKPGLQFPDPPQGVAACGEAYRPPGCPAPPIR
ncbi:MAG TPA: hypothetical protein VL523_08390 [Terriglobia bacterium]|nr:hypothetical protein [Terriglobia bacterium]